MVYKFVRNVGVMGTTLLSMTVQGAESNLLGCWRCDSGGAQIVLRFNASHYVIDGEPLAYRLVPGAIQVPEPDGHSLYPYRLDNDRLTIDLDDSPPLACMRSVCPGGPAAR